MVIAFVAATKNRSETMRFYLCDNCYRIVLPPIYLIHPKNEGHKFAEWCEECYREIQELIADAFS